MSNFEEREDLSDFGRGDIEQVAIAGVKSFLLSRINDAKVHSLESVASAWCEPFFMPVDEFSAIRKILRIASDELCEQDKLRVWETDGQTMIQLEIAA